MSRGRGQGWRAGIPDVTPEIYREEILPAIRIRHQPRVMKRMIIAIYRNPKTPAQSQNEYRGMCERTWCFLESDQAAKQFADHCLANKVPFIITEIPEFGRAPTAKILFQHGNMGAPKTEKRRSEFNDY